MRVQLWAYTEVDADKAHKSDLHLQAEKPYHICGSHLCDLNFECSINFEVKMHGKLTCASDKVVFA